MKNQILLFSIILFLFACNQDNIIRHSRKDVKQLQKLDNLISNSLTLIKIKKIPTEVFDKTNLTYLSVIGQDCCMAGVECFAIREIPKEIKNLKNLETLSLTLNYIEKLPLEILELKKLKILSLTDNPSFSDIETVSKMKWLEEFYCYGCNLSKEEIEYLKKQLSDCKIGVNY
ncbi:hypothetical protein ACE193_01805 [Bernardetia sp. OM2101]|uniref:leucine-rich repeat domain-containing protein n=1 Tax=Bernardetia sp. OM2101 TaxID=3344876 RepID=UPI0035CF569B